MPLSQLVPPQTYFWPSFERAVETIPACWAVYAVWPCCCGPYAVVPAEGFDAPGLLCWNCVFQ